MGNVIIYGTFDLFHIGHKNILDRAKEIANDRKCKLIVGVTSPEYDKERGKELSYDSLEQRIKNVVNYCNPDNIIIENYKGQKIDDIKKYDIDTIVFGSDWKGKMDYLKEYCKVLYLPRTEGVSSTLLRKKRKINDDIRESKREL